MTYHYQPVTTPLSRKHILKGLGAIWIPYFQAPGLFGVLPTFKLACNSTYHLTKTLVLPKTTAEYEEPPTVVTMTINPDLTRLWYFFAKKALGETVRFMIVDSSGLIRKEDFPGAQVVPLWNFHHSKKFDYLIRYVIKSRYTWICDDDVMILGSNSLLQIEKMMKEDKKVAVVSFIPNDYDLVFNQQRYRAMGSYCLFIDRKVFLDEELSFGPVRSDNFEYNHGTGYYETADFANEQLLRRGYKVEFLLGEDDPYEYVCGFDAVDSARIRLLEGKTKFDREIKEIEVPKARHRIIGTYCNWKVVDLYREAFGEEPQWLPPVSIQDIGKLVELLGDHYVEAIGEQFKLYDERARIIKQHLSI